jgi:hypothetical protein
MVGMLAIAAAAGWLLAFSLCAVVTRLPPRWAGSAAPWPGPGGERPALVNLVVTRGQLGGAAYPATVLDLAAKGHLMIKQRMPGQLWCDVPAVAPADTGLAQSERLVLADARRLADRGGAPFEAVAESCASNVRGTWALRTGAAGRGEAGRAHPAEVSFQGQVIARWVERRGDNDNDWDSPCIVHLPVIPCGIKAPRQGGVRLPGQPRWGWCGRAGAGQGTRGRRGDGRGGVGHVARGRHPEGALRRGGA